MGFGGWAGTGEKKIPPKQMFGARSNTLRTDISRAFAKPARRIKIRPAPGQAEVLGGAGKSSPLWTAALKQPLPSAGPEGSRARLAKRRPCWTSAESQATIIDRHRNSKENENRKLFYNFGSKK
jgi:hypothetical protein